jgi:hypothetical protein
VTVDAGRSPSPAGTVIAALTLIPTVAIASIHRRRSATVQDGDAWA